MVLLYMVTWIPSIYPLYVSIYTSTMDPMGMYSRVGWDKPIFTREATSIVPVMTWIVKMCEATAGTT